MRRLLFSLGLLLSFTILGMFGFRLTEGWDWLQCLYEAVIIMTTVGLSATNQAELRDVTKVFIIVYLVAGVGIFTYCVSQLGQYLVNLQLSGLLERRKMDRAIERLSGHYVICGFGRMGREICRHLDSRRKPFVVIDTDMARLEPVCREKGWPYLAGDATDDATLLKAGLKRAKSLATVLPTDADNVYVVLTARLLNDQLQIIARASDEKAVDKLQRAGASRVVSPFTSGAVKIARFMLNPSIEDFLEVTDDHGSQLELADILISANSPYVGKTLMETDLRDRGIMVIGIRRADGERLMPPPGSAMILAGDSLFAFGSSQSVNDMINASSEVET
jgi:voltage-gated potassium channel